MVCLVLELLLHHIGAYTVQAGDAGGDGGGEGGSVTVAVMEAEASMKMGEVNAHERRLQRGEDQLSSTLTAAPPDHLPSIEACSSSHPARECRCSVGRGHGCVCCGTKTATPSAKQCP